MKNITFLFTAAFLMVSGCSMENLAEKGVDQIFPDAQRYVFYGPISDRHIKYACAKGAGKAAADKRAKAAHKFFDRSLEAFARKQAEKMIAGIEADQSAMKIALSNSRAGDAWAQAMHEKMITDYQCVSYGQAEDK